MTVARTICLGFIGIITVSTILLMLPISNASGQWTDVLTALFTITSATCVTGLAVVDTGTHFSFFGQLVLTLTIQLGGLGYMTATTFLLILLGRRSRLQHRIAVQESLDSIGLSSVSQLVISVIATTALIELTGTFVMMTVFVPQFGWIKGTWMAIFHSVSAFNNAGFALFPDNLIQYATNPGIVGTIGILIILGGIGYQVIMEAFLWLRDRLFRRLRGFRFSMHTKTVTSTTFWLLLIGFLGIYAAEFHNPATMANTSLSERFWLSIFQSITTRTAGFNSLDIGAMTMASLFLMIALMFIGASPGSTGGGIKTTTLRILSNCTGTVLRGRESVILYRREVPKGLLMKAISVFIGSVCTVVIATVILAVSDPKFEFIQVFFEVVSAFGTVGLSMGITAKLSTIGKLTIIAVMYIGRVGVLLLMEALLGDPKPSAIRYPEEDLLVG